MNIFLQFNHNDASKIFAYFVLSIIIFMGILFRVPPTDAVRNGMDEFIEQDVIRSMQARGDFNTDMALISNPASHAVFASSYHSASYLTLSSFFVPVTDKQDVRIAYLRNLNLLFYIVSILMLLACMIELKLSNTANYLAILLLTFSPGLVHDSMMARPESFMTALMLVYLWANLAMHKNWMIYTVIAGMVLGSIVASKFSMALIFIVYLLILITNKKYHTIKSAVYAILLFCISALIGFTISAPYAVFNFSSFMEGVKANSVQYYSLHPPHSHINGGNTLLWQIEFYTKLYGIMFIAPVFVVIFSLKNRTISSNNIVISISAIIFFCMLATANVFFERNLHPILPLFILATVFLFDALKGISFSYRLVSAIFAVLLLTPLFYWSIKIREVQQVEYSRKYNDFKNNLTAKFSELGQIVALRDHPESCGLVGLIDYSDQKSEMLLKQYYNEHWKLVGTYFSPFQYIPTSTMQTYLAANSYWFYKECKYEPTKSLNGQKTSEATTCTGSIDYINGNLFPKQFSTSYKLEVQGWLAPSPTQGLSTTNSPVVVLTDSTGKNMFFSVQILDRPDVASAYKNADWKSTGFKSTINISAIPGDYTLGLGFTEGNEVIKLCPQFKIPGTIIKK